MTTTANRSILPADMISVEDARARILERFTVLAAEETPLLDAQGLVLAEDVRAGFNIPPLANTSMDGYAVRADDTAGAAYESPRTLRVIGYLAAGHLYEGAVGPGEAVRIMTGAPIPEGADAIVPFEETDEYDWTTRESARDPGAWQDAPREAVRIDVEAKPRANIRDAGEDVREGDLVLPAGTVVGPAHTGVLASLGLDRVRVHRRPIVAILSTGDELLRPGEAPQPGKIYDANAFSIAAMVRATGGEPVILDVARDTVDALTARIHEGLARADLLVTTAGVSRGDFDVVKTVLAQQGEIGFWTVNMKPGKPLAFGVFQSPDGRTVPHLGLPGNPVSAMVTFELFGRAAMFKMLGKLQAHPDAWQRPTVRAVARERITNSDGRRFYARCIATPDADGGWAVRLTGPQGSGVLTSVAYANAFAVLPEGQSAIEVGEACDALLVDRESPVPPPSRG